MWCVAWEEREWGGGGHTNSELQVDLKLSGKQLNERNDDRQKTFYIQMIFILQTSSFTHKENTHQRHIYISVSVQIHSGAQKQALETK